MLKVSVRVIVAVLALVISLLDFCASTEKIPRKWATFSANITGLSRYNVSNVDVKEEILCSILATKDGLATNLFCFGPKGCVFGQVYLPDVEGEQTPDYSCYYSQVCLHDNKTLHEGEVVPSPICLTCTKRGMVNLTNDVPPLTSCTPPFVQHPFGCMYFNLKTMTLCEARAYCQSLGAQLASPTTHDNFLALVAYLLATYGTTYQKPFWAGVYYINGNHSYESNGRWPGPDGQYEWFADQPNYGGQDCVRFSFPTTYRLADDFCTSKNAVICHAWNLEI
ncbi:uncharacterized protein LOC125179519 [Hyalella azteca]|uniref:Uncharacterized protein LOC125179519 n=1 Tax=Hyalella azteca TaxID=294128 RepID=A0A979FXS1_HYAAZ|nr:uncharacterized protein LOC125179519 [Hyalella azteca]